MPPLLTETAVKAVKPAEKARKIYDERGLFLFVPPTGARLWRMKYKVGGREKLLALGEWPHTSLKRARERRDEVRKLLADGIDPAAKKKAERQAIADTFSALAKEYLDTKRSSLNPKTLSKAEWLLDDWLNKYVGKSPVRQVTAADILSVCRRIEAKGKYETAHRARALASRVMRYGVITGRVDRDPCGDLRGALTPVKTKNHAAITDPAKVGELLRAIDGYQGQPATGVRAQDRSVCIRTSGRTACRCLARVGARGRGSRVAHPGNAHEDGRAAHCSPLPPGGRAPEAAAADHW